RQVNVMAGAIDVADRLFGLYVDAATDLANLREVFASAERIAIRDSTGFRLQDLRVGQLQFLVRVSGDGKEAGLKEVFARIFQKPWVALAADDFVVNPARLFARADLADEFAVTVPDGEFDD